MLSTFQRLGGWNVNYDSDYDRWEDRASLDVGDHTIPNALRRCRFQYVSLSCDSTAPLMGIFDQFQVIPSSDLHKRRKAIGPTVVKPTRLRRILTHCFRFLRHLTILPHKGLLD